MRISLIATYPARRAGVARWASTGHRAWLERDADRADRDPIVSSLGASLPVRKPSRRLALPAGLPGSVTIVAVMLALLVAVQLHLYGGHIAGLVNFGQRTAVQTHPPRGTPLLTPDGYDGQIYWIQAHDPLLLSARTVERLHTAFPGYFLQRPAYPALAWLLSAGQPGALPWALLAINALCVLALTVVVSRYAMRTGHSAWWGLAVGLMPGLLMPALRDLSDVLAVTTMLMGLIAWRCEHRWRAAALLAVAVLAREPMTLAVAAIAVDAAARWWSERRSPGALRAALRRAWPAVLVPAAAFYGWHLYVQLHVHVRGVATGQATSAPVTSLTGYIGELHTIFAHRLGASGLWDLAYVALMVAGSVLGLLALRRGLRAPAIAALLFAGTLLVVLFGDWWGETRYSAPMFGALLLAGLELRSPVLLRTCALVAGMGVLAPLVIPGL